MVMNDVKTLDIDTVNSVLDTLKESINLLEDKEDGDVIRKGISTDKLIFSVVSSLKTVAFAQMDSTTEGSFKWALEQLSSDKLLYMINEDWVKNEIAVYYTNSSLYVILIRGEVDYLGVLNRLLFQISLDQLLRNDWKIIDGDQLSKLLNGGAF
jgi:hypothetical protein